MTSAIPTTDPRTGWTALPPRADRITELHGRNPTSDDVVDAMNLTNHEAALALLQAQSVEHGATRATYISSRATLITTLGFAITIALLVYKAQIDDLANEAPIWILGLPAFLALILVVLFLAFSSESHKQDRRLDNVTSWVRMFDLRVDDKLGDPPPSSEDHTGLTEATPDPL